MQAAEATVHWTDSYMYPSVCDKSNHPAVTSDHLLYSHLLLGNSIQRSESASRDLLKLTCFCASIRIFASVVLFVSHRRLTSLHANNPRIRASTDVCNLLTVLEQ